MRRTSYAKGPTRSHGRTAIGSRIAAGTLLAAALMMTAYQARAQADAGGCSRPRSRPRRRPRRPSLRTQPARAAQPAVAAPSQTVVVNLIRLLVQEGVMTQDKANALIRQAEDEAAAAARGQTMAVNKRLPSGAPKLAAERRPGRAAERARSLYPRDRPQADPRRGQAGGAARGQGGKLGGARSVSGLGQKRPHSRAISALRYENGTVFDKRNSPFFPNFSALNAGSPFDLNNAAGTSPPLLDTTQDRQRLRERFRLGIGAQIDDEWAAGVRLATGNTTNPVSTNQTLGTSLANDSFNLDRAFIRFQPYSWVTAWLGRFPDPWFSTDLVWDDDVNFDGVGCAADPKALRRPFEAVR